MTQGHISKLGEYMRDKWYGDNRDLVKWGVLLTLAEQFGARHILQVLYYRLSEWARLELDGEMVPLPSAIIQHFRRAIAASEIESTAEIEIITDLFQDRDEYLRAVIDRIRRRSVRPGIVFLDPDTGLAPHVPSLDHVLDSEVGELWGELRQGDLLVLYQHQTNRNGKPWIAAKQKQFERAAGLPSGWSKAARSEPIARDVVLFYAQKVD